MGQGTLAFLAAAVLLVELELYSTHNMPCDPHNNSNEKSERKRKRITRGIWRRSQVENLDRNTLTQSPASRNKTAPPTFSTRIATETRIETETHRLTVYLGPFPPLPRTLFFNFSPLLLQPSLLFSSSTSAVFPSVSSLSQLPRKLSSCMVMYSLIK